MTTKTFCSRCEVEVKEPTWLVGHGRFGFYGERRPVCEDCKESFEDWLGRVPEKKVITDKQIRKVLNLTSFPTLVLGSVHCWGEGGGLGPEEDMIVEVRKILGITGEKAQIDEPIQTPQEELVDVPVVRTVRDEGEGSSISGEENPS